MTRLFIQFSPSFLSLPVASIEPLRQEGVEFVGGLFCGAARFHEWLLAQPQCAGKPIFYPDLEELEWAGQPLDEPELERIRHTYGDAAIQRIIIGERHVGFGYVTGANITSSPLTQAISRGGNDSIWQYVVALIKRTEEILDETRPDFIFQYAIAGGVALATQIVSGQRGIPSASVVHTRIGQKVLIAPSEGSGKDEATIRSIASTADQESIQNAREYIETFRNKPEQPEYISFVADMLRRQRSPRGIVKGLAKATIGMLSKAHDTPHSSRFFNGMNEARKPMRNWFQGRVIRSLAQPFRDFEGRPFAFYPLHVDPEATTMVLAPDFTDQINIIQRISQSLPPGMPLLVKEHVPMVGSRPRGFYRRINQMPGVALISAETEPYQLIKSASIVITISGTAGFEAAMLQRPVLLLGNTYYQHMEGGITRLHDHVDMRAAIAAALNDQVASDDQLAQFIGGVFSASIDIPSELMWSTKAQGNIADMHDISRIFAELLIRTCKNQNDDFAGTGAHARVHAPTGTNT